jgi:hypothetical protein
MQHFAFEKKVLDGFCDSAFCEIFLLQQFVLYYLFALLNKYFCVKLIPLLFSRRAGKNGHVFLWQGWNREGGSSEQV